MTTTAPAKKPRPKVTKKKLAPKAAIPKKPRTRTPAKKAVVKKESRRPLNDLGFVDGTDSAIIAATLVAGGADRANVNDLCRDNIEAANGITNRNGKEKYIPSMVSGILTRMVETGQWEVQASWRVVPTSK